ncbi:MAG: hypothetical protein JWL77_4043 [Chthonomonadaceae bacterium]|nr:hypothetical protein [Chthonomonadaceae bacterium]
MRTPKRTITFLGCICVGAAAVLGMLRALRHSASPLEGAQAITSTTHWQWDRSAPAGFAMYYWSGRDDIQYVSKGTDGTPHLFRRSARAPEDVPGTEGPAVSLRNGRYAGQLSPDGKWFVEWHRNKLRQNIPTFVSVEGGQRRDGEPTWGMEGVWTPDSAAMVSGVWRSGAAIDRYDPSSGLRQTAAVSGLKQFYSPQHVDASGHLVGFADSGYILNFGKTPGLRSVNYPRTKMIRVDLAHPENRPEEWTVAVPENMDDFGRCLLAPTCDRILWVVRGDTTPLFLRKLRGYVPGLKASSGMGYRWLVSGLHGENMHEVASYRYKLTQTKNGALPPIPDPYGSPRWMPDGRHISFLFRDTLYTRPVD